MSTVNGDQDFSANAYDLLKKRHAEEERNFIDNARTEAEKIHGRVQEIFDTKEISYTEASEMAIAELTEKTSESIETPMAIQCFGRPPEDFGINIIFTKGMPFSDTIPECAESIEDP